MGSAKLYALGAIAIGILQTIDGILLVLNKGSAGSFNLMVALAEFLWVPFGLTMIFVFRRMNLSLLSPVSYVLYNVAGWIVATLIVKPTDTVINQVPLWASYVGIIFGIYYLIINDRLYRFIRSSGS